jgi:hypothetical protein
MRIDLNSEQGSPLSCDIDQSGRQRQLDGVLCTQPDQ